MNGSLLTDRRPRNALFPGLYMRCCWRGFYPCSYSVGLCGLSMGGDMSSVISKYMRSGRADESVSLDSCGRLLAPDSLTEALTEALMERQPLLKLKKVDKLASPQEIYAMLAATALHLDDIERLDDWLIGELVDVFLNQLPLVFRSSQCETCGQSLPDMGEDNAADEVWVNYAGGLTIERDPYSARPYILFYITFKVGVAI